MLGLNATETKLTLPNGTNVTLPEPTSQYRNQRHNTGTFLEHIGERFSWGISRLRRPLPRLGRDAFWGGVGSQWHAAFFADPDPIFYHQNSSTIYNLTQLNDHGNCSQLQGNVGYQWGVLISLALCLSCRLAALDDCDVWIVPRYLPTFTI